MVAFFKQHNCKDELKASNLKATPARVGVMKFLESVGNPADAETILRDLNKEGINADPATIYRILDILYKKGLIQKIELGEGKYRYEKSENHHHHLICTNCGKIEDIEGDFVSNLENKIREKNGFLVKSHSLEFFGLCKNCQK
jgi:Fur family ferric uptake transcriptional regulator